jgi:hypothetical protein
MELEVVSNGRDLCAEIKAAWTKAAEAESTAMREIVRVGALLLEAKEQCVRGEFADWLAQNIFPDMALPRGKRIYDTSFWRKATRWMEATRNVFAFLEIQSGHGPLYNDLPISQVLSLPAAELPPLARKAQERVFEAVQGKTLAQLTFRFESLEKALKGGDKEWEAWLKKHHRECIKDGVVPPRKASKVPKAVWAAWEQYNLDLAKKANSPDTRLKIAEGNARQWLEVTDRLVQSATTKELPAPTLDQLIGAAKLLVQKLKDLRDAA